MQVAPVQALGVPWPQPGLDRVYSLQLAEVEASPAHWTQLATLTSPAPLEAWPRFVHG